MFKSEREYSTVYRGTVFLKGYDVTQRGKICFSDKVVGTEY